MSDASPGNGKPPPAGDRGTLSPFLLALQAHDIETLTQLRHALRTPLNQIIGYSEMLLESIEDLAATRLLGDIKKIHTAGGQLLALFNDALAPWKIETGKIDLVGMRREMLSPLNAIIGYSELCQEEAAELGKDDVVNDLKRINLAGYNLHRLFESGDFAIKITASTTPSAAGVPAQTTFGPPMPAAPTSSPLEFIANAGAQGHTACADLISVRDFHRHLDRIRKYLRPNRASRTAASQPRAVDLASSRTQLLNMTQVAEHDALIKSTEQMSTRVPARHAVKSRSGGRLHVRSIQERVKDDICTARGQVGDFFIANIIDRYPAPFGFSAFIPATLVHKPLQVGG